MDISLLYEDDHLVVVNKPAQIPSQPTVDKKRADVFTLLKKQLSPKNVFLHHRLDVDTSGVLLFSKNKDINGELTNMFREHRFEKIYWALTKTHPDLKKSWVIENHLMVKRLNSKSSKMVKTQSGGEFSKTEFLRLKTNTEASLIECKPITGRMHQIRVHCLLSHIPILGDTLYEGADPKVPRLMLHAKSLEFTHPITKETLKIEAPLPADFQRLLRNWDLFPSLS